MTKYGIYGLVIPVFHGIYGEDGQITAFLKTLGSHYAFSDFDVHALCIDKYLTNQFVRDIGIHIPETIFLRRDADFDLQDVSFPAIVKPNRGGSSLSTSRVSEHDELAEACMSITDDDILIQECIE
jgi:D-alanine-D-alanine ligase